VSILNPSAIKHNNHKSFFELVLKTLQEQPQTKFLLSRTISHPCQYYEVIPNIVNLLKKKTLLIRCPVAIKYLERLTISEVSNQHSSLLDKFKSNKNVFQFTPEFLIQSTNPIPSDSVWPVELKHYTTSIAQTYKLKISLCFCDIKFTCFEPITLSSKIAFTFLSMGKESLWSLSRTILNASYELIVVMFVNNANFGTNCREHEQFVKFSNWFLTSKIDIRVKFYQVEYNTQLLGIQNNEDFVKINKERVKEPLVKMQYLQLLGCKLIREHKCGTFIVPMDFEEKNFNNNSYFGDQPESFSSFNYFFLQIHWW